MDVRLPDGTVIQNVPDGISKADLTAKLKTNGYDVSKLEASAIDQIPGVNPNMAQPALAKPLTLREKISGAIETPFAVGANILSAPVTYLAGAGGPEFQRAVSKEITYQPRTQLAQEAVQGVAKLAEESKIPPYMTPMRFGQSMVPVGQAVGDVAQAGKSMVTAPIQARNALAAQNKTLQSYQNAPRIDAAKDALDLGVALNPATANPTAANKLRTAVVGSDTLDTMLAQHNQAKFTAAAKQDLGLPETTTLNAKAFDEARNRTELSAPYKTVREIKDLTPNENTMAELEVMRVQPLVGDTGQAIAANKVLDAAKEHLTQGVDGKTLLNSIRARRQEAQAIYKQRDAGVNPPSPEQIAKADMNLGIANAMENMIESHIGTDAKLLADFRNARTAMAKTYDYERATNLATGQVDPQVIAKMAAQGKPLTGTLAKIGNVAANYPEVSKSGLLNEPNWRETLPRSGAGGTIGALLGSPFGLPGSIAGGAIGAATSNVAGGMLARSMTKPSFQAGKAMPPDYRPPMINNLQSSTTVNNLRP